MATAEVMMDKSRGESFGGHRFLENRNHLVFNFVKSARLINGLFDKNDKDMTIFALSAQNPFFKLLDTPHYFAEDDLLYFPVYGEKLAESGYFIHSHESSFERSLVEKKSSFEQESCYYLLIAKVL